MADGTYTPSWVLRAAAEKRRVVALNAAALSVIGLPNTNTPDGIIRRAEAFEDYLKGDDDA